MENTNWVRQRACWVVYCFPYLDQTALWETWTTIFNPSGTNSPLIEGLTCPSSAPTVRELPWLASNVANAGWAFSDPTGEAPTNPNMAPTASFSTSIRM